MDENQLSLILRALESLRPVYRGMEGPRDQFHRFRFASALASVQNAAFSAVVGENPDRIALIVSNNSGNSFTLRPVGFAQGNNGIVFASAETTYTISHRDYGPLTSLAWEGRSAAVQSDLYVFEVILERYPYF